MFEVRPSTIPGCCEIQPILSGDSRGRFVKTFHAEVFAERGMATDYAEQYYSVSRRGVLRGLHFQTPPHAHAKLVYCTDGAIFDAVLDLRAGSPTYGQHAACELSALKANQLYIPEGLAHGFYVTSASATMVYNVTSVYAPKHDAGILWNSAGIDWPDATPVLSERDGALPPFDSFESPFRFDDG